MGTRIQKNDGALFVNKGGSLLAVQIDAQNLVSYIMNSCSHIPDNRNVGIQLASRYGLPGADGLFLEQFNRALSSMDIQRASQIAASSPGSLIRNMETINKLKSMEPAPGQPKPIMIYF